MFPLGGGAQERAVKVAAALEGAGHQVSERPVARKSGVVRRVARESPDVVHAVGSDVAGVAAVAARLCGAALICEKLSEEAALSRGAVRAMRTAAIGRRGGAVLARDEAQSSRLRSKLGLPYLPPIVGDLAPDGSDRILLAVYDRLPRLHPVLPVEEVDPGRARRWLQELGEPVRRGGLRRPGALLAYLRGRRLRARGRIPEAIEALSRAAQRDSGDPVYELYAAKALRESGRTDEALDRLEALAAGPDGDPALLGEVGVELARLGRSDRAQAVAGRLADGGGEPGSADAWAEAARICAVLGQLDSARELALQAAAAARDRSTAQRTAALALEMAGEPSQALQLARRAGEESQERRLDGLLRELGPGWAPQLAGDGTDRSGSGNGVLALLEVSLPQAPSGYAYRSRDVLEALRTAGFEPLAATRLGFPVSRGSTSWSPVEGVGGIVHHRFNVPGLRQYSGIPLDARVQENAERLLDLVRRRRPAVIVAGTPDLNGLAALALRAVTGIPVVYDVRGFPEMSWAVQSGGSDSELYSRRRDAETACASSADAVITLSETMREELAGRGVEESRIFVIPHVVDPDRFAPRPRDPELARSYGLEGKLVVGSVTSLTDYEGIDDLLRAIARARAGSPEVAALIVGDGRYRPTLEELASELGIADSVVFTGRIDQDRVPDHYALLDLFAIPRRDLEVCRAVTPLKPFEALAMEIPVLASDVPALAEIVSASGGGRTVPPGSPAALAEAIVELGSDRKAREQFGRSGRKHVIENHTPDRVSEVLRDAVLRLLGNHSGRDEH
jgi:glycosyltransferase involved in cell wall biosynthesis/tetratricopeptide (TPR) repeat protein